MLSALGEICALCNGSLNPLVSHKSSFDSSQAATTAIVQHPEHGELYARDPFCAGFFGPPLHALLDIAAVNQASTTNAAAAEHCKALPSALAQC